MSLDGPRAIFVGKGGAGHGQQERIFKPHFGSRAGQKSSASSGRPAIVDLHGNGCQDWDYEAFGDDHLGPRFRATSKVVGALGLPQSPNSAPKALGTRRSIPLEF